MIAVPNRAAIARRTTDAHELHPVLKHIIEAMVADIIAEEANGPNSACIVDSAEQE